ncbi:polycomb group RING finger protein 6 isoform X2 [Heterocephalus glaber]|uniref:Polycomb group RING finger protein 6 isoform X2 n=1 Tax=Heterocephalus glaber TaxID=10181 RepID=A0AAX6RY47_HETGA|nr:polycomb group RING finger protein 6 isoform X2 [Heterocephalus glaber]
MEGVNLGPVGHADANEAEGAAAPSPPPPASPPALVRAPAAGEDGPAPQPEAGAPGCSGARPPELLPERCLGRLKGRFEEDDEELEDEELEEEEEEEEEEMSHFSLRLEGGRPDSEDEDEDEERLINLTELTPYILCSICKGYLIDATTITECLHTFCKSCIVRHFYYSNRCPKCNIVVHQTQPLYNIRLDRQLQDIVYKLVINLEEREKKQMHDFYKERGLEVPKPAVPQTAPSNKGRTKKVLESVFRIPPELDMSLLLEFIGANEGTGHFKVDILCGDHLLERCQTLREIRRAAGEAAMQCVPFRLVIGQASFWEKEACLWTGGSELASAQPQGVRGRPERRAALELLPVPIIFRSCVCFIHPSNTTAQASFSSRVDELPLFCEDCFL